MNSAAHPFGEVVVHPELLLLVASLRGQQDLALRPHEEELLEEAHAIGGPGEPSQDPSVGRSGTRPRSVRPG